MRALKRPVLGVAATAAAVIALGACSPASSSSGSTASAGSTTVTVRLWDDQVAKAYESSFAEFTKENPSITVKVNVVPWANYWDQLPIDVGSGAIDDIFWLNSSNVGKLADAGKLLDIGGLLGADAAKGWQSSVVDQYTLNGKLWGVPQLSDANGVFYNADLLKAAGVDPTTLSSLAWAPGGSTGDTLLPVLKKLTKDAAGHTADSASFDGTPVQYGYNAGRDLQAIYYPFVGSNGGKWQADDSDKYVFADDANSVAAIQYVVDLVNKDKVSPSAADTNENGDFSRDAFLQGKMAIFQSGTYNLANVEAGAKFTWGLAAVPAGPAGSVTVANGIIAAGSAQTKHKDATAKVLAWLGSDKGAGFIASGGAAFPAVTGAQQAYLDYWKSKNVDVQPFLDAAKGKTIGAPKGASANDAANAYTPFLKEVFLNRLGVATGLKQGQDAANAKVTG